MAAVARVLIGMLVGSLVWAPAAHAAPDTPAAPAAPDPEAAAAHAEVVGLTSQARALARADRCDLVRARGSEVRTRDPEYFRTVFLVDPVLNLCLRNRSPRAAPPGEAQVAGEASAPEAAADEGCGDGFYAEPAGEVGVTYTGKTQGGLRNAAGIELHLCDAHGRWDHAIRIGATTLISDQIGSFGGELEVDWATAPDQRVGLRVALETGVMATGGVRYRTGALEVGADLIVATGDNSAYGKGVVGHVGLTGRPGGTLMIVEVVVGVLLLGAAISALGNGG